MRRWIGWALLLALWAACFPAAAETSAPADRSWFVPPDTAVVTMDRAALYRRIDLRVDQMMEQGLLEEVKRLRDEGVTSDMVSMQGLGYRQIFDYLEGIATLEEAVERIKKETRHFAKRQLTWFRREPEARWINVSEYGDRKQILEMMTEECLCLLEKN